MVGCLVDLYGPLDDAATLLLDRAASLVHGYRSKKQKQRQWQEKMINVVKFP